MTQYIQYIHPGPGTMSTAVATAKSLLALRRKGGDGGGDCGGEGGGVCVGESGGGDDFWSRARPQRVSSRSRSAVITARSRAHPLARPSRARSDLELSTRMATASGRGEGRAKKTRVDSGPLAYECSDRPTPDVAGV